MEVDGGLGPVGLAGGAFAAAAFLKVLALCFTGQTGKQVVLTVD